MGADAWLDELPLLVAELEREWSITVGTAYSDIDPDASVSKANCI